ncbi:MAG TPA: hypothetical protein VN622_07585, partial [Clostridia bacterium]|nr:hypothetical protein [Clostridia bacterium]
RANYEGVLTCVVEADGFVFHLRPLTSRFDLYGITTPKCPGDVGDELKFAIERGRAYVLDAKGKEWALSVVQARKK